jgi:hypothetical protein
MALLGVSFDTLEPTQMGLIFDANMQHVETDKVIITTDRQQQQQHDRFCSLLFVSDFD